MLKWLCLCLLLAVTFAQDEDIPDYDWDDIQDLDTYVHFDDGYWDWYPVAEYNLDGVDVYVLNMTSQKWMDENYSIDCIYWWHWVIVAVPTGEVRYSDHAAMMITGGDRDDGIPDEDTTILNLAAGMANDTRTIAAVITQVPLQPCNFQNDDKPDRREDSIIAWTWRTAIDDPTRNPVQVARMPFTKAAKRGLDTISAFVLTLPQPLTIDKFAVLGASKRGWTTWSLAATDQRVVVAAPIVFSLLNAPDTLMSHYQAMGGAWSFAFGPYYDEDLTYHLLDPTVDWLFDIEDMIRYRSRLTIPKLLTVATGDEFFLNQDSHHWWDMMTEPMYMMMNPNAEHVLFPHYVRIYETIVSFWLNYLQGNTMPNLEWTRQQVDGVGGVVNLTVTNGTPRSVRGFYAETLTNDTTWRRDYRLQSGDPPEFHQVRWYDEEVDNNGNNEYGYAVEESEDDIVWKGHFIESEFDGPEGYTMLLTTEVNIVPDTFPVGPCNTSEECYGYLT